MIKIFIALLLGLSSISCGTTGKIYKFDGADKKQVLEIHLDKNGALIYKDKDVECQFDSRSPTVWERFISPVIGKATKGVQATAPVE